MLNDASMDNNILIATWLLCLSLLLLPSPGCFGQELPLINGTSIVLLDNKGASPNEPTNIAISWSFTFDIFVKDADDFVTACHGYCTGVDFDRLYNSSSRACKYMLVSNVLQYIESNSEYDGLYDLQAMQRLKTDTEIIETKEQETKAEEIKEQDRLRLAKYLSLLEEDTSTSRTTMMISNNGASSDIYEMNTNQKVALIVPSTSKRYKSVDELPLLLYFMKSLDNTLAAFDTMSVVLYLGYDEGDAMYDNEVTMNEIVSTIQQRAPSLLIKPVRLSGFEGKVVHIWNGLTRIAYDDGCEYYFLLGDDVLISTFNWIPRMINILRYESKLLQNFGTVAFYDLLQPNRPTFPVFHSTHLMIFGIETAFDPYFINSYADPWISDIYESFNSSFIAKNVKLYNAVGGDWRTTSPRYVPTDVHMEDYIDKVQRARRRIAQWVGLKTPIKWNPSTLAYMEEGIFYAYFCNGSIGCKGKIEESPKQFTEYRNNLVE